MLFLHKPLKRIVIMSNKKPKLKNVHLLTPEEMREMKVYNDPWYIEEVCPDGKIISCETSGTNWETIMSAQGVVGIRCGTTMVMCDGREYVVGSGYNHEPIRCPFTGTTIACDGIGDFQEEIYDYSISPDPIGLRCGNVYKFCFGGLGTGTGPGNCPSSCCCGSGSGCCGSGSGCCGSGSGCCGSGSGCCGSGSGCCGSGSGSGCCGSGSGCCGMKSDDEQNENDSNLL